MGFTLKATIHPLLEIAIALRFSKKILIEYVFIAHLFLTN